MLLKIEASNIPSGIQIRANKIDTPDNVNATGYPKRRAQQTKTSNSKGIISILF
jgi:hypothetical protein